MDKDINEIRRAAKTSIELLDYHGQKFAFDLEYIRNETLIIVFVLITTSMLGTSLNYV